MYVDRNSLIYIVSVVNFKMIVYSIKDFLKNILYTYSIYNKYHRIQGGLSDSNKICRRSTLEQSN